MLPSKRRLFVPLMVALLASQQLYTVVMPRGDADHTVGSFHNFSCDVRVQDIKSGSSSEDFNWWSIFATENPEEVNSLAIRLSFNLLAFGQQNQLDVNTIACHEWQLTSLLYLLCLMDQRGRLAVVP
jgi:hypothetical protein